MIFFSLERGKLKVRTRKKSNLSRLIDMDVQIFPPFAFFFLKFLVFRERSLGWKLLGFIQPDEISHKITKGARSEKHWWNFFFTLVESGELWYPFFHFQASSRSFDYRWHANPVRTFYNSTLSKYINLRFWTCKYSQSIGGLCGFKT